jgi:hypothetical protein
MRAILMRIRSLPHNLKGDVSTELGSRLQPREGRVPSSNIRRRHRGCDYPVVRNHLRFENSEASVVPRARVEGSRTPSHGTCLSVSPFSLTALQKHTGLMVHLPVSALMVHLPIGCRNE